MLIKTDFPYTPKGANRPLHIWLPEDCQTSGKQYPVMYFFDGHNLFRDRDATYGKSWGLESFLAGWDKEMIVVGMECGHEGNERLSEYLPYPAEPGSWFSEFAPMGGETLDWICREVKPWVDGNFPTIPFRECTGIAGSSMGGLMALYTVIRENRLFSKAGCFSSAIGFCLNNLMTELIRQELSPDTRVYLSWGTQEAYGLKDRSREDTSSATYYSNRQVALALEAHYAAVKLRCQVGGGHSEAHWEKLVPECMEFLWEQ